MVKIIFELADGIGIGAKKKFSRINDWKIGLSAVQDYSDQQIFNLVLIDRQTL